MKLIKAISSLTNILFTNRPFNLILYVTARCNARCSMCYYLDVIEKANDNISLELSMDEIHKIFLKLGYVPYLSLSGGEPFLRNDIAQIVDSAAKICRPMVISVPTNCSNPKHIIKTFESICPKYPDVQFEAHVSLDGLGQVHDNIRKIPGLFDKVLETTELLNSLNRGSCKNLKTKLVSTYSSHNQDQVEDLIRFAGEHMHFERMILAMAHGTCSDVTKQHLDKLRYAELCQKVEAMNRKRMAKQSVPMRLARRTKKAKEHLRDKWDKEKSLGCYCNAGKKILVISEQGEVYPCEPLRYVMGNVRNYDYDVLELVKENYVAFLQKYPGKSCHCDWGCAQNIAVISNLKFWPDMLIG